MGEDKKIAVNMATLESHNHIVGDIERGVKIYHRGGVEFMEYEPGLYWAQVPHKGDDSKAVTVVFSRDGQDIEQHSCHYCWRSRGNPVCRHVVAAVLAIQGEVVESKLALGKTATVRTTVTEQYTAAAVCSGSLDVFATPMMIALMEQAACAALADALEPGQASVGTQISVAHTAASPLGAEVTAAATIESVFGRRIEFSVTAGDGAGEIGSGKHTRVIVDGERLQAKALSRGKPV